MKQWIIPIIAAVLLILSMIYFMPHNIGISGGDVDVNKDFKTPYILVHNIQPASSMYGTYWLETDWNEQQRELTITCISSFAKMGKTNPSNGILVDPDFLSGYKSEMNIKVFINTGNSRELIGEVII